MLAALLHTLTIHRAIHRAIGRRSARTLGSRRDAGYTTETVLVTALLVALALAALAILYTAVTNKAASIQL
jgi:hypothetical protein